LGAKPIRMAPSVALPNGTLILGTPYIVTYNNSDSVFYLQNMTNPMLFRLAGGMDFWGTTTPNSSFAFPIGQAISRTTFATLFSIMGTTYGVGEWLHHLQSARQDRSRISNDRSQRNPADINAISAALTAPQWDQRQASNPRRC
jgi:hypothetical protein